VYCISMYLSTAMRGPGAASGRRELTVVELAMLSCAVAGSLGEAESGIILVVPRGLESSQNTGTRTRSDLGSSMARSRGKHLKRCD
jgi:hypothetical protein